MIDQRSRFVILTGIVLILLSGCSVKKMAMRQVAGSFDNAMDAYTRDGDPEFVEEAMPSTLKMVEMLLTGSPENPQLLNAAAGGFTMYSHAFIMQEADVVEENGNIEQARQMRDRGKQMFLRARDYGLRGLEVKYPGFRAGLNQNADSTVQQVSVDDLSFLYWTAASWGSAISSDTDDYKLVLDLPKVEALITRALELDDTWGDGQLHDFMISFQAGRAGMGGSIDSAEYHFQRALELNQGHSAGTYVTAAEAIAVRQQDQERFRKLLDKALAVDIEKYPDLRLSNALAHRRAEWLLEHIDRYFY
ncbi:MAG: TRAP transporter TatT component family protein [Candidatus Marinimicrobia bacterium]|nr:TRAP transporter TatT component family protein [Candidatus Neomarinimicrobiota bacterium]MCF7827953.1 TRAP transporter TatT component family protein [Candidatus Neomarinimicrobiota bacterium]MCF7879292.1 TRAP transporter TatT component family protein [Candidatus Neomarinimicrobiota bacterium]